MSEDSHDGIYSRINDLDRRQTRMQAQFEEASRIQVNTQSMVQANAKHISESSKDISQLCARMEETNGIANAGRDLAEDLNIKTAPVLRSFNESKDKNRDWRKYGFVVLGAVSIYGIIELIKFFTTGS